MEEGGRSSSSNGIDDNPFLGNNVIKGPEIRPGVVRYNIKGTVFDIPTRYTPIKLIGQGAFGIVCSALDHEVPPKKSDDEEAVNPYVAIKKINLNTGDVRRWIRALREIKLMRHFDNENVLGLKDIFEIPGRDFAEIYIVTELMDADLHQIISSNQPLTDDHYQLFLFQMLRGLKYIHSAHVMHRDLKPSNLFINKDCMLKLADFGLARVTNPQENHENFMSKYVATRWYRAPEVILSWEQYTKSIDVWAVGCVFAELLLRKPIFQGKDYVNQIAIICSIMGTPSEEDIQSIESEHARRYIRSLGSKPKMDLRSVMPRSTNPLALDLLDKMLIFSPVNRWTVDQCLAHPYLSDFHDPDDEPECHGVFDFGYEKFDSPEHLPMYREMVFQEMLFFHPSGEEAIRKQRELEQQQQQQQLLLQQQQQQQQEEEFLQQQMLQQQLLQQQQYLEQLVLGQQQHILDQQEFHRQQQQPIFELPTVTPTMVVQQQPQQQSNSGMFQFSNSTATTTVSIGEPSPTSMLFTPDGQPSMFDGEFDDDLEMEAEPDDMFKQYFADL